MTIPALPVPTDLAARLGGTPLLRLLDIDGTLTPIAPRPSDVVVSAEVRAVLTALANASGVHVAVVTGRSVGDARRVIRVDDAWFIGNHGLEIAAPGADPAVPDSVAHFAHPIAAASARIARLIQIGRAHV